MGVFELFSSKWLKYFKEQVLLFLTFLSHASLAVRFLFSASVSSSIRLPERGVRT